MRGPCTGTVGTGGRFTNTAVPKFDGNGCWQQHLEFCIALAKSNGWMDETAALQLFAHLEGEEENSKSVTHRTGADPATFATELEILAVRGFGDMGFTRAEPDGPGQIYCEPTYLWTVAPP